MTSKVTTESAADRVLDAVRRSGGRVTQPTRAVVAVLTESTGHLTAEDLIAEIDRRTPGVAPSTIYRVIQRLGELDVLEHVHTGVGPTIYHLRERGHAHLVCNDCGAILDIADEELEQLSVALARKHGFVLERHHSALLGRCSRCAPAVVTAEHRSAEASAGSRRSAGRA